MYLTMIAPSETLHSILFPKPSSKTLPKHPKELSKRLVDQCLIVNIFNWTYKSSLTHQAINLAACCHVNMIWMVVPTDINQTFNPYQHLSPDVEEFFIHVLGIMPVTFCMKFTNWILSKDSM
jgi:NADH:ubiquinone oxidoreductase subunit B-like Fe-S oxidoreductase